jgi:hypothetical protein
VATDRTGLPISVGTRVRVLEIPSSLLRDLPPEERQALESMIGEVFEVSEIDEHGTAWVEKAFDQLDGERHHHSLALDSHEMEVV